MHNVQLLADGTRRAAAGQVAMPHENSASFFGTALSSLGLGGGGQRALDSRQYLKHERQKMEKELCVDGGRIVV
jgi:hypothetical protein